MGRKKKKQLKPWCWYCNREFDDEKILIQHQKAKHFKCHICHKKLYTGPGLSIHCMQVHKEKVDKVPNSVPGRHNIEIEIYGMEGIPDDDLREHERQKHNKAAAAKDGGDDSDEDSNQGPKPPVPAANGIPAPPVPASAPMPFMGGMPPIPPPMGMAPMGMRPGMGPMGPMGPMMGPGMGPMPPRPYMPGMPGAAVPPMSASQMSAPSKPLFPSAAASSSPSSSATTAGPPKPTFPSAATITSSPSTSNSATITGAPQIKKPESSSGLTSKLMHPDEDISLEEKRLSMSKYAHFATKGFTPLPQSMAAPTSTMGMPPVSAMGMAPNPAMGMAPNNMGMGMGPGAPGMRPPMPPQAMMGMPNQGMYNMGYQGNRPPMYPGRY
ncbi:BUB3-interacting and GLEBS motif-containing protein ZNF207-like isoform X1 [Ruditapes philippinarum]|uniref:BUB3-interacting and GLEBS motif-containing protein ZNF207-like isoform X1 n=1 Tax=Ruditapes philippinarum TaxID=129788 RepID=UPI00295B6CB1|nr:BUB3-interacting and GLEBS motif-containing protein ZNF207-like isoform X1 [Ruditapes philippinarum]